MTTGAIASAIRAAREAKGWTQQDLADAVGVTQGAIWQWEAGRTRIDERRMREVAAALGVPLADLLHAAARAASETGE